MNPNTRQNTALHDPLRDIAPRGGHGFHADPRLALLALLALALVCSIIRLRRTDFLDPEHPVRRDMVRLLAVVWGGLAVEWARSRCDLATPGFWFASAALLPFVVATVALSMRLFRAYREPEEAAPLPAAPTPKSAPKPASKPVSNAASHPASNSASNSASKGNER